MKPSEVYCTSFCNSGHRVADGKPVGHECYILPPEAIQAERDGDIARALVILDAWKNRRTHKGVR